MIRSSNKSLFFKVVGSFCPNYVSSTKLFPRRKEKKKGNLPVLGLLRNRNISIFTVCPVVGLYLGKLGSKLHWGQKEVEKIPVLNGSLYEVVCGKAVNHHRADDISIDNSPSIP